MTSKSIKNEVRITSNLSHCPYLQEMLGDLLTSLHSQKTFHSNRKKKKEKKKNLYLSRTVNSALKVSHADCENQQ